VSGTDAPGIDDVLVQARTRLLRVEVQDVPARLEHGAVLVDIRPLQQRAREGEIAGAHVIERNVLEWRLDPASDAALPWASRDLEVLVICQEGYASSLAAESLVRVGIPAATDVVGGVAAWKRAGLPWTATVTSPVDPPGGGDGTA
jgi:rhodanese-related sulfurtransferase